MVFIKLSKVRLITDPGPAAPFILLSPVFTSAQFLGSSTAVMLAK